MKVLIFDRLYLNSTSLKTVKLYKSQNSLLAVISDSRRTDSSDIQGLNKYPTVQREPGRPWLLVDTVKVPGHLGYPRILQDSGYSDTQGGGARQRCVLPCTKGHPRRPRGCCTTSTTPHHPTTLMFCLHFLPGTRPWKVRFNIE